jgi:predicted dehydrogenase
VSHRVGIVGLGNAALTLHLPALAGVEGVTLVGGCDPDDERRANAEDGYGFPVFEQLSELLSILTPEVVVVCTPPELHAAHCVEALEAGAHVICEKPFATSVGEAEKILAAAERSGRRVALNHEFREVPMFRALRDEIGGPEVGELVFAQAWQLMDLPPWKEAGWRSELLNSTLYEAGIHLIDYLVYLFGERPCGVTAVTSSCGAHEADTDAVALVTLEFSGGRLGQVTQNRLCPGDLQYFEVRADCTQASLRASFGGRARLSAGMFRSRRPHLRFEMGASGIAWRELGDRRAQIAANPKDPAMIGTRRLLEKTLSALAADTPVPVSAEEGRTSLEVIAACYKSASEGRRIELGDVPSEFLRDWRLV